MTAFEFLRSYSNVVSTDVIRDVEKLLREAGVDDVVSLQASRQEPPTSILMLDGLGKEIWEGVDAKRYIDGLRDEWDNR